MSKAVISISGLLLLCGCTINSLTDRYAQANFIAAQAGMEKHFIQTQTFDLAAWIKPTAKPDLLTVYIEGDGLAWISRTRLSADPTPKNPLAMKLATIDPRLNVAYPYW